VEDQPVVRVAAEGLGHDLFELGFDLIDVLARREAGAVADAEHMGVDRERLLAERGVEDHVGGLAADAGKRLQLLAGARDFPAEAVDQRLAEGDYVLCLGVEEADHLDRVAEVVLAERHHLLGRLDSLEERPARDVHARIGRLGGQHDRDEQLKGIAGLELGRGRRIRLGEPAEEFENLVARHLSSSSANARRPSASLKVAV
jgi:hypothetical protein